MDGVSTTLNVDADDELTSTTGGYAYSYGYNANGEQTSCTIGGVQTTFGYDYEGQLTSIASPSGTTYLGYNGDGRQGARTAGGVTIGYYNDGPTTLVEKNMANLSVTDSYVWGAGGLGRHNGETALYDGLGVERQVANTSQSITATNVVSAYGSGHGIIQREQTQ